jgi:hypothetical protein
VIDSGIISPLVGIVIGLRRRRTAGAVLWREVIERKQM